MEAANAIDSTTTTTTKHQKLAAEKNQEKDTNKFHYHFLYKAALVAIFFVILPLLPSQAPEFINQSLVTRNWELLHILFVGIAISYGLFSRRHDETDKENNGPKFDNAQSLVAKFLQVSSFFEDEAETPSSDEFSDETKVQTWNNQHYRNKPVVVVAPPQAQQRTHFENKVSSASGGSSSSRIIGEKPLLLPVRSLKSRLCDDPNDDDDDDDDGDVVFQPFNRSNSYKTGSKRFSSNNSIKARNAELEGPGPDGSSGSTMILEKMKDNVVLPSPIPWRSRSGKFEPKQEAETLITTTQYASNSKPSMEESEFNEVESRSLKSQTPRNSSRTSPMSSPSPKLPPSPLLSSESLAKSTEDVMRKKGFYKSFPPPPPPPPPVFQKSISTKPIRYGSFNGGGDNNSIDKELKRSLTSEGNISRGKKVRDGGIMNGSQLEDEEEHFMEEPITRKSTSTGKGFDNVSYRTDKFKGHVSVPLVPEPPAPMEFVEEEEKESFLDRVILETDDDEDTETEDEDVEGIRNMQKKSEKTPPAAEGSKTSDEPSSGSFGDEGPDVDKKADEFIARFREQIRLQRIESIKRSTRSTRTSSR